MWTEIDFGYGFIYIPVGGGGEGDGPQWSTVPGNATVWWNTSLQKKKKKKSYVHIQSIHCKE